MTHVETGGFRWKNHGKMMGNMMGTWEKEWQNHGKPIKVPTKTFLGTGKIEDLYGEPVS